MNHPYIQKAQAFLSEIAESVILNEDQIPDSLIREEMCCYRHLDCQHGNQVMCPRQIPEDAARVRRLVLERATSLIKDHGVSWQDANRIATEEAFATVKSEILRREMTGVTP
jgi:hypothetical protein